MIAKWFSSILICILIFSQWCLAKESPLLFPILVNEIYLGEVRVLPDSNGENAQILMEDLINIGGVRLSVEDKARLEELKVTSGYASVKSLRAKGIDVDFDMQLLRILWKQDPSKQSSQNMMESDQRLKGVRVDPEPWSFLFNLRASQNIYAPDADKKFQKDAVIGDHDFALKMRDVVLEGYFKTTEGSQNIYRQDFRFVYDHASTNHRIALGDVQYSLLGDQVFQPILGVGLQKDPSLGWSSVSQTVSGKEIVLNRFSLVEIYINGVLYRSQRLGPGRFSINDLPVVAGYNQVDVVVTDENGESQKLQFPYLSEESLLQNGESRYTYNFGKLGFDRAQTGREYKDINAYSLNHRYGLSEVLTMSIWGQGDSSQNVGGFEGVWGHRLGLFSLELSASKIEGDKVQAASGVRYRSPVSNGDWLVSYGLGLEHKELRYSTWGELNPYQRYEMQTEAFFSWSPFYRQRWTLGGQFAEDRFGLRNRENLYSVYSMSFMKNAQLSFELAQRQDAQIKENSFFIYLNWIESKKNVQVFTSYQKKNDDLRSNVIWEPPRRESPWALNGSVRNNDLNHGAGLETKYRGSFANLGLSGDWVESKTGSKVMSQSYRWNLGTAFLASSTTFGFSRPIADSALVIRDRVGKDTRISVAALEDLIGEDMVNRNQLTLPELNSYRSLAFKVELEGGSQYSKLMNDHFVVFPTYRSLTLVDLKTVGQIVVKAQILNSKGKPLALTSGRLMDSQGTERGVFFTDRNGHIYLDGVSVGRWQLEFFDESESKISFEVPEATHGELQLDPLSIGGER